jgi:hypothetical protein
MRMNTEMRWRWSHLFSSLKTAEIIVVLKPKLGTHIHRDT